MRARDLAEEFPVVRLDDDALEATRTMTDQALPGLVVVDEHGGPLVVLPASEVLRFALPEYVEEDPALARVYGEREADNFCSELVGRKVRELMPGKQYLPKRERDRPVVTANATLIEIASVMTRCAVAGSAMSPGTAVTSGSCDSAIVRALAITA